VFGREHNMQVAPDWISCWDRVEHSVSAWAELYRTQELERFFRRHVWTPQERALIQAYSRRLVRQVLVAIACALETASHGSATTGEGTRAGGSRSPGMGGISIGEAGLWTD